MSTIYPLRLMQDTFAHSHGETSAKHLYRFHVLATPQGIVICMRYDALRSGDKLPYAGTWFQMIMAGFVWNEQLPDVLGDNDCADHALEFSRKVMARVQEMNKPA